MRTLHAMLCIAVFIAWDISTAQAPQMVTPRMRVAVMDLTGSALKMQTAQAPNASGGITTQTTISIPPPAEFARALTEALTTSLTATGKFIVLERVALQHDCALVIVMGGRVSHRLSSTNVPPRVSQSFTRKDEYRGGAPAMLAPRTGPRHT